MQKPSAPTHNPRNSAAIAALRDYLNGISPGPIDEAEHLEELLATAWSDLAIERGGGMQPDKIWGRLKEIEWDPPRLSFVIERHGAVVKGGSSRAELQTWSVNVNEGTASYTDGGWRQVRTPNPPLDTLPLAKEIARLIAERKPDPRLKWTANGQVRVLIGQVVRARSTPKLTVAERGKRFRRQLDELLSKDSWKPVRPNLYAYTRDD
jgi:hypothetical protein